MSKDPIVAELHAQREAYMKRFQGDWQAMYENIKKREEQLKKEGWKFTTLEPKQAKDAT